MQTVKGFCYLADRLNASGECETAVTSRVRIGRIKFRVVTWKVFFENERDGVS